MKRVFPDTAQPQILVVDDIPENIQILGQILGNEGYSVVVARSGIEAIKAANSLRPNLVLLDVMMPEMSGYEVCETLKSNPDTASIPIIFVSALSETKDEIAGLSLGAIDYITKPFEPEIVLARVKRHLVPLVSETGTEQSIGDHWVKNLLDQGETELIEFKSTIRWNILADRSDKSIELAWAKTIVAFLNSHGGSLLIGVDDNADIVGLEKDRFKNLDKLMLHVDNVIETHVGMEFSDSIAIQIVGIDGKKVLVFQINPSSEPAFLSTNEGDDMYIRLGPSSRKMTTREAMEYVKSREK